MHWFWTNSVTTTRSESHIKAPTLPTACGSLPPEGACFILGRPCDETNPHVWGSRGSIHQAFGVGFNLGQGVTGGPNGQCLFFLWQQQPGLQVGCQTPTLY